MSPKARVLRESDPQAAARLAAWAEETTAGEYDEAAGVFRVAEGKEDLFRTAAKLAGVELGWEESANPGAAEAAAGVRGQSGGNPGTEQPSARGNPGEGAAPGKPAVPPVAAVLGVGLAGLLAWSLMRPVR